MLFRKIAVVCISIALGCSLTSCGKSKKAKKENTNETTEKFMKTLSKPDQEAVALLSQKYDLQPGLVESFLDRYLSDTDMGYKLLKDSLTTSRGDKSKTDSMELLSLEKEKYYEAMVKASQVAGITIKNGALLVSDYKMLTKNGKDVE
ncbi:MAG: hypothetical protein HYS23_00245 [Geobacter sp.]|nr:hypothetical protein [Geobacter sp.]